MVWPVRERYQTSRTKQMTRVLARDPAPRGRSSGSAGIRGSVDVRKLHIGYTSNVAPWNGVLADHPDIMERFGMQELETRVEVIPERARPPIFRALSYPKLKRVADLIIILLLLPAFCLLMLLIMIAIKLYSPGPIFYRQKRIGKDGVPFDLLKFRSMRIGSDSQVHRIYVQWLIQENIRPEDVGSKSLKLSNDMRITGLGKILRSLGLDELPQFINVLRGEMSLVGPRPPMPYEYELYNDWHKQRLGALPGITGLWQVTAHNQVSFDEMVQIDLDYIASMSLWLDLKIIILTPLEMLRVKGGGK